VGLGLSIVASVVTAHDGHLQADALPTGGLKITVRFPTAAVTGDRIGSPA
jgi:two-component system sensor histidine kinase VanS